jgi:cytochrome c oxidase subunit 2
MTNNPDQSNPRRVLIASSHGLFGQGLRSLLRAKYGVGVEVVGMVSNLREALNALEELNPDLIIVDYDDEALNRDEFLVRFVESEKKLRVVLLSLQSGGEAIVYDRRTMAASQIDDWLEEWTYAEETPHQGSEQKGAKSKLGDRRLNMKKYLHPVVAGGLVFVIAAGVIFGLWQLYLSGKILPIAASAQAQPIDNLFKIEGIVIGFLFSLIVVLMMYSIVVFRRRRGDTADAPHVEGNTKLEIAWTLAPLATVLVFAYLGSGALADTMRADPKPLTINVIGQKWAWRFEYPQYGIVSDKLYMPEKKQALLRMSSVDIIHSFWVPEFRVKQDALPGGPEFVRDLRVTPEKIGSYKLRCAELCGEQHTTMIADVLVLSQADFDAWVAQETGVSDDPVVRGEKAAQQYGCLACHSIDGVKGVGPTWKGSFGSQVVLADGTTVTADDTYLKESIVNPNVKLHEGFAPNLMPQNFGQTLNDQQIADIIEFIKSLK